MIEYVCVCVTVSKERCTGIPLSPSDGRISKIIQGYERNLRSSTRLSTMKMIRGGGWMTTRSMIISATTTQTAVVFHSEYIAAPLNEENVVPVM